MKTKTYAQNSKNSFYSRYTRDDQGFYVRNEKPSAGTLNDKRIEENVRSLVNELADLPRDASKESED